MFIISAPSGAGKTTLCSEILNKVDNLRLSVSFTTRAPREGEVNNRDYTFIAEKEFRDMIAGGEFVEWAEVHGNLYGTSGKRLEELMKEGFDVLLDIDTQGAKQIRDSFREGIYIFVLPPSMTVLRERIEKRGSNTPEDMERRLRRAVDEIKDYALYEYVIVNDVLKESLSGLEAVITSERLRSNKIDPDWIKENFLL